MIDGRHVRVLCASGHFSTVIALKGLSTSVPTQLYNTKVITVISE
jgi:hypothetical protein